MKAEIENGYTATVVYELDTVCRSSETRNLKTRGLDRLPSESRKNREQLIEILQDLQDSHGYLPEELLREVAGNLNVPLIEMFRIVNFYKAFSLKPKGQHQVTICNGTACHVRRSDRLVDELRSLLGVGTGETTEDGKFTVETVNCLGACALGPIVVIDGEYHDHVTPAKLRSLLRTLAAASSDLNREVS